MRDAHVFGAEVGEQVFARKGRLPPELKCRGQRRRLAIMQGKRYKVVCYVGEMQQK